MAYLKLAEGWPPFTPVRNSAPSADMNELQDQLKGMLQGLWVVAPPQGAFYNAALGAGWKYYVNGVITIWRTIAATNQPLFYPLGTLRAGQKITAVEAIVSGGGVGGHIKMIGQRCAGAVGIVPASDLAVAGSFEYPSFNLDYVRDGGTVVPSAINGAPALSATGKIGPNCVDFNGVESLEWNAAGTVDGVTTEATIECWIKPGYSGYPAALQYIVSLSDFATYSDNFALYHHSNGHIYFRVHDFAAVQRIGKSVTGPWSPIAGIWHHIEVSFSSVSGAYYGFLDGVLGVSGSVAGFVRTNVADILQLGKRIGMTNANDFMVDRVAVHDTIKHTTDFTPPASPVDGLPFLCASFPADPWNTGGAWTTRAGTLNAAGQTVGEDTDLYLELEPASIGNENVLGARVQVQFGN